MLAEAIITSTIVLTTLVGLYANFMKLYNVYKIRDTYYDIDGVYAIKNAIDAMIDDGSLAETLALNTNYKLIINNNNICTVSNNNNNYCNFLKNTYSIKNMYVVKYDKGSIGNLKGQTQTLNQTFKDYLNYIEKYYNFNMDEDNKYSYLFVVEYQKNQKYYNSSLGVR